MKQIAVSTFQEFFQQKDPLVIVKSAMMAGPEDFRHHVVGDHSAAAMFDHVLKNQTLNPDNRKAVALLGGNSIKKIGMSFGLKNGLRFHFDSVTCLNYPFANFSLLQGISSQNSSGFSR